MDFKRAWLDYDYFIRSVLNHESFLYNVKFSVLAKLERWEIFRTITPSVPVICTKNNLDDLSDLYNIIKCCAEELLQKYKKQAIGNPDSLVLEFFSIITDVKYSLSTEAKSLFKTEQYNMLVKELNLFGFDIINTPYVIDFDYLNSKYIVLKWDKYSNSIKNIDDYLELEDFNTDYLSKEFNRAYIDYSLFIKKYTGRNYVIINMKLHDNSILKIAFNDKGVKTFEVLDYYNPNNQILTRHRGALTYTYYRNKLIYTEKQTVFKAIKPISIKSKYTTPNQSFGTLDLETFTNKDLKARVYAIGYYIHDTKELDLLYIDRDLDSFKLIHNCFEKLLKDKHKGRIFYVHNLGKFDSIFILKALSEYNKHLDNPYSFDTITRDRDVIKLKVKRTIDNKVRHVTLLDSWAMLPISLRDLCKAYELTEEDSKSIFPYSFVKENTLWYSGQTPAKTYYDSQISNSEYKSLEKPDWHLMFETLKYLKLDLTSLHKVLRVVNTNMFLLFQNIQMTESITITSLALKILYTKFYNDKLLLPLITNKEIYHDIKASHFGGRVEVFRPHGCNLKYYDVNSLYPSVAINNLPGLKTSYMVFYNYNVDIDKLFGFFYCKVTSPSNPIFKYIGMLPYRNSKGSLTFPIGSWEGWYFSEEFKFAAKLGYKIQVLKGYNFDTIEAPLKNYIMSLDSIKSNPRNKAERQIAKLLSNSSLGRFGMSPEKPVTRLVTIDEHNWLLSTRIVIDSIAITEESFLDTYINSVNKEVCEKYGLDFFEVKTKENSNESKRKQSNDFSSISTASAVLGYSRIRMAEAILYVLNNGGKIYYTDTDSLVTDIKLPDEWVSPNILGKFKLEHEVEEAYFIADKFYALKTNKLDSKGNNEIVIRSKGISRHNLTWDIMKSLYETGKPFNTTKKSSIKDIKSGSVRIEESDITLSLNYTKRLKKYDSNGLWIDTLPLVINEGEFNNNLTYKKSDTLSLIIYKNRLSIVPIYN